MQNICLPVSTTEWHSLDSFCCSHAAPDDRRPRLRCVGLRQVRDFLLRATTRARLAQVATSGVFPHEMTETAFGGHALLLRYGNLCHFPAVSSVDQDAPARH